MTAPTLELVPIPWQQHIWVAPATLTLLQAASKLAGHNIVITAPDGGWRSYVIQLAYWMNYLYHGGPVASNPDTGNRAHPRGAALDIAYQADRKWMLLAGFIADTKEWWHFNHPNWRNMPIITKLTPAGLTMDAIVNPPESEDEMNQPHIIRSVFHGGDFVQRPGDGAWRFFPTTESGNLYYVGAKLGTPDQLEATKVEAKYINAVLEVSGAPDSGTMVKNPNQWYLPRQAI